MGGVRHEPRNERCLRLCRNRAHDFTMKASKRRTYGLGRASLLAALDNASILLVATGAILVEAVRRFRDPAPSRGVESLARRRARPHRSRRTRTWPPFDFLPNLRREALAPQSAALGARTASRPSRRPESERAHPDREIMHDVVTRAASGNSRGQSCDRPGLSHPTKHLHSAHDNTRRKSFSLRRAPAPS